MSPSPLSFSINNNDESLTESQIKELAVDQGRKLGFFITHLQVSEEIKEAWLDLLPHFSLEQLDRLTKIFESQFAEQQTQEINKKFKEDINKVIQESKQQVSALNNITIKEVTQLIEKINTKI